MLKQNRAWHALGAVLLAAGCGGSGAGDADWPARIPVTGEVFYKGQAVEGATVTFSPQEHSHAGIARTDATGRFELQTFEPGDDAVPGLFLVAIRKVETDAVQLASDDAEGTTVSERSLLPFRYADPKLSGLTATVKQGGETHFKFELEEGPLTSPASSQGRPSKGGE